MKHHAMKAYGRVEVQLHASAALTPLERQLGEPQSQPRCSAAEIPALPQIATPGIQVAA
jgi:hypothetical protein